MLRLSEDNMNQKEVKTQGGSIVIIQIVVFLDPHSYIRPIRNPTANAVHQQPVFTVTDDLRGGRIVRFVRG